MSAIRWESVGLKALTPPFFTQRPTELFSSWRRLERGFIEVEIERMFPEVGDEEMYRAVFENRVQIGDLVIEPSIFLRVGHGGIGEEESRRGPFAAAIGGRGHPDLRAVFHSVHRPVEAFILGADMSVVIEKDQGFSIRGMKHHRRRVGVDEF